MKRETVVEAYERGRVEGREAGFEDGLQRAESLLRTALMAAAELDARGTREVLEEGGGMITLVRVMETQLRTLRQKLDFAERDRDSARYALKAAEERCEATERVLRAREHADVERMRLQVAAEAMAAPVLGMGVGRYEPALRLQHAPWMRDTGPDACGQNLNGLYR